MKKPAISRNVTLCLVAIAAVGIIGLVFVAPDLAAIVFVVLVVGGAIAIGKREGGWRGLVAFAKDLIFGW